MRTVGDLHLPAGSAAADGDPVVVTPQQRGLALLRAARACGWRRASGASSRWATPRPRSCR